MLASLTHARGSWSRRAWQTLCEHPVLLAVVALAVWLRLHRIAPEFHSADGADVAAMSLRALCDGNGFWAGFKSLATFKLGGVQPLLTFVHAWFANLVGLNLDASSWAYPTLTASAASVVAGYALVNELSGKGAAVGAALLLALSPIHIMLGRHLGAPWAFETASQLTLLWLSVRLARRPTPALRAALYALAASYIWCGNQMAGIFPVLAYTLYIGYRTLPSRQSPRQYVQSLLGSKWLILLLISVAALLYLTFAKHVGHMSHALFQKRSTLGWHFGNWHTDAISDLGYVPTYAGLLALISCCFVRSLRWERILVAYGLCYTLPFWFLLGPHSTLTTGYVVYGLTALLLAIPVVSARLLGPRACALVSAVVGIALLIGSLGAVHRHFRRLEWIGVRPFQGSYKPPIGVSAAAAYIQRVASGPKDRVFSDASGGSGLEPSVMRVYFRRPYLAHYNAKREKPYKVHSKFANQTAFLVTLPGSEALVQQYFPGHFLRARVTNGADGELLGIYSKQRVQRVEELTADLGMILYSSSYPTLCSE